MDSNTKFEIKASVFHKMTGMLAPGKDGGCMTVGESFEERIRAWDKWHIENDKIIKSFILSIENVLDI